MEIKKLEQNGTTVLALSGMLDSNTSADFQTAISELLNSDAKDVKLDLTNLEYISSQGLRLILSLQKGLMANGGKLVVSQLQPVVKEVFDITGFSNIFTVE